MATLACAALGACALWALRPIPLRPVVVPEPAASSPETPAIPGPVPLDRAAFTANLWTPPPDPPPAASAPATQPPRSETNPATPERTASRLQLLAIVREPAPHPGAPSVLRAAIFDPDTDRIYLAASGDRVGSHRVTSVEDASVVLSDGRSSRTLRLETPEAPAPAAKERG